MVKNVLKIIWLDILIAYKRILAKYWRYQARRWDKKMYKKLERFGISKEEADGYIS